MRVLVASLAVALALAASAAGGQQKATLRVVADSPLTLVGSGFASGERVRVSLVVPARRVAFARATPTGRFTVRIADAGCVAGMVVATAKGLRSARTASVRRLGPACPPG